MRKKYIKRYYNMFMRWLSTKVRFFILRNILTYEEKYLLIRAITDKIEELEVAGVKYRWIDKHDVDTDCLIYGIIKDELRIKEWA